MEKKTLERRIDILSRGKVFIMTEYLHKIAGVLKTTLISDFTYCFVSIGKAFAGSFNSIIIQIVHR